MYNQKVGQYGEELARKYLIKKGYKIIECNIKASYKEIDLIAKAPQQNTLVFFEVKTRTSFAFGKADEAMSRRKISHLKKAIGIYLEKYNKEKYKDIRLDFIAIDINKKKGKARIRHYKEII